MTIAKRPIRRSLQTHNPIDASAPALAIARADCGRMLARRHAQARIRLARREALSASRALREALQQQFRELTRRIEATQPTPSEAYHQPSHVSALQAREPVAGAAPLADSEREFDELLGRMVRILANTGRLNPSTVRAVADLAAAAGVQQGETGGYAASPAARRNTSDTAHPLDAARERGRLSALQEWENPANLPLKEAATLAGRSDRMLNLDRQAGRLYALVLPGRERGFRYPSWQLSVDSNRLAAALAPFVQAGASCWVTHSFMHRQRDDLQGLTPAQWIADPARPIEAVVQVAQARYRDEQGAA